MKLFFTFLVFFFTLSVMAQTTSTTDGKWIDGATWGGSSPGYTNLADITIESYVISDAGLTFSGTNKDLIINDTLVVYGNVIFNSTSGATVSVGAGNVLIIFGDLDMGKNHAGIDIGTGGMVIVTGNVLADPSGGGAAVGDVTGAGTLYTTDGSSTSGFNVDNDGGELPTNQISETGGSQEIEDFVTGGGATPLPVEFLFFTGKSTSPNVDLTWATASEKDNDRFEVERSEDGVYFYSIGVVEGSGTVNEQVNYSFVDFSAVAAISYYRLKQVDYDGEYEYSETIRVETGVSNNTMSFNVYPTLVTADKITINANRAFEVKDVEIYSLSGSQQGKSLSFVKNHGSEVELTGNYLEKGIYLIKMNTTEGDQLVKKVVVR
ncbi:T9SS type A sorting domain-containing protein [Marinoscillum pacificum]|uniref:T9SS type A sorting domain-containing protein n=1 Tax=Marinoscillum pacificum TaxID=392723 RepID=UPI0021587F03|nr:T9SS type A sorting domain-containing protein [Marinoscillum pacificum]